MSYNVVSIVHAVSTPALANTTPVTPPRVNKNIKPIANNIGVLKVIDPPHIVAIQENTLIPVGTAIIIVAAKKYALVSVLNQQYTYGEPTQQTLQLQLQPLHKPFLNIQK